MIGRRKDETLKEKKVDNDLVHGKKNIFFFLSLENKILIYLLILSSRKKKTYFHLITINDSLIKRKEKEESK